MMITGMALINPNLIISILRSINSNYKIPVLQITIKNTHVVRIENDAIWNGA